MIARTYGSTVLVRPKSSTLRPQYEGLLQYSFHLDWRSYVPSLGGHEMHPNTIVISTVRIHLTIPAQSSIFIESDSNHLSYISVTSCLPKIKLTTCMFLFSHFINLVVRILTLHIHSISVYHKPQPPYQNSFAVDFTSILSISSFK